ncbi:cyclic GMP-AMP synthase-like receptor 3 isoform X1 [Antedon mediterranea]|uniref:cyclic GMP-AMP synthase-like receptor 3 isoform X1 n=1 Tax=Antedon mediterranea TaxID=105859 RepID=UPI003AF9F389
MNRMSLYDENENVRKEDDKNVLLSEELMLFYKKCVVIDESDWTQARMIVNNIIDKFQIYTKEKMDRVICQGSSFEGLRVTKPIEFDLLVPLKLDSTPTITKKDNAPGYYFIHYNGETWKKCTIDGQLSPILMCRKMQAGIGHAVVFMERELPDYQIKLQDNDPAKQLTVKYRGVTIYIDLVPAVEFQGQYLVAKRHHKANGFHEIPDKKNVFNYLWRRSYSQQEKTLIRSMDIYHRVCLKVLKAVAFIQRSQFGKIKSYHLKTCLLHLNERSDKIWKEDDLGIRFKELINILLDFLKKKELPCFFDENINLFEPVSDYKNTLNHLNNWLKKNNNYIMMLKDSFQSQGTNESSAVIVGESIPLDGYGTRAERRQTSSLVSGSSMLDEAEAAALLTGLALSSYFSTSSFNVNVCAEITGNITTFEDLRSSSTVKELKEKISKKHLCFQRFTYKGIVLEDSKTLGDYGICEDSTVNLVSFNFFWLVALLSLMVVVYCVPSPFGWLVALLSLMVVVYCVPSPFGWLVTLGALMVFGWSVALLGALMVVTKISQPTDNNS